MKFKKIVIPVLVLVFLVSCDSYSQKDAILVFSKTVGYRHKSIETGVEAIKALGLKNNFVVHATEDANYMHPDSLKNYGSIVFLSTTLDILNKEQEDSFKKYIQSGGGFVGVHAATDTEYEWEWYGKLVGGYFKSHPKQQKATLNIIDNTHISTKMLPKVWEHFDEWYNFKNLNPNVTVLISIDESSYEGGENGTNHPIAWYHEFDGGKVFYTGLGHTKEAYSDANFLAHLLGGIQYTLGKN